MTVAHIEEKSFPAVIAKGTVLIDFYATWCGPCRMMEPILNQLSQDLGDTVTIAKVDVDEAQQVAMQYDISSIPTLLLFKDGKVKERFVGVQSLQNLKAAIEKA